MKRKFDWDHSITRKDVMVLTVLSFVISMAAYAYAMANIYENEIKGWMKTKIESIKTKLP